MHCTVYFVVLLTLRLVSQNCKSISRESIYWAPQYNVTRLENTKILFFFIARPYCTNASLLRWEWAMAINMHMHSAGLDELHACSQTSHLLNSLRRQRTDFQMITCFIFLLLLPATSHEPLQCVAGERERKKRKSRISVQKRPVNEFSQGIIQQCAIVKDAREIFKRK